MLSFYYALAFSFIYLDLEIDRSPYVSGTTFCECTRSPLRRKYEKKTTTISVRFLGVGRGPKKNITKYAKGVSAR